MRQLAGVARLSASLLVVAGITLVYVHLVPANPATVALTYVAAILLIATAWDITEATAASVVAVLCLNFFFLPPVGTFTIADPQNWAALVAFLLTAIVTSQLSGRARRRTQDAVTKQRDLERLYALSRGLLLADSMSVPSGIVRHLMTTFDLEGVALYAQHTDTVARAGTADMPGVDATLRDVARQGTRVQGAGGLVTMAIGLGGVPVGSLAIAGPALGDTVLQSIANLAAIGLERARGQEAAAQAEAARQSGELRAAVLDALAHEFKTPLTSIKAAGSALVHAMPPGGRDHELATIVNEEADRLQTLVTDAVRMLRIESSGFTIRREPQDLASLTGSAVDEMASRLSGHDVVRRIPDGLTVLADGELVRVALHQLLDNAVKYSKPGSSILLTAEGTRSIDISVHNSGSYIPAREQPLVFDRFYRGTGARHAPGTGLGLAIVRQIAQAHGGSATVTSDPDTGTTFTFSLPHGEAPA